MKIDIKFHVVALFAAMTALSAQAAPVSSAQVCRAVSAWAAANGSAFATPGSAKEAKAVSENGTNLYWIVKMSDGGAVIASPDTDLDLVVAVLEKFGGDFPAGHPLPSILRKDMLNRLSIVRSAASSSGTASGGSGVSMASMASATTQSAPSAELPEDVKASVVKANAQWEKYGNANGGVSLLGASLEGGDASPYVRRIVDGFEEGGCYTHWDQSGYQGYNLYTPGNVVCGCVATAGAAIMQFFRCTNDIGVVEGVGCLYNGNDHECATKPGELDWSLLPTNGSEVVYTDAVKDLIGRATYNMGVLVGMSWAPGASGAYVVDLADVFKRYGFKTARAVSFGKNADGTAQYFKTIYAQNWANAPVVMGIRGEMGGHAVVACGYAKDPDGDEFCRVFMGWGGYGDAWYKFPEIDSFNVVDSVVTMIGLDDDAVVPVCGWSNVASTEIEILSDDSADPIAVVPVDANGYFAVRISSSLEARGLRINHPATGKGLDITPYDSAILQDESKGRTELEAALPDEIMFWGLDTVTKTSVSVAREKAKDDGKALLMVSGSGGRRDTLLMELLCHLDATTDMSNRFVFVHVKNSDAKNGDGDPSIGVFDPTEGSADLRWWDSNGRLAYENFIDYDSDSDEVEYTFSPEDTAALTNSVGLVLNSGYDLYARRHSGIVVEVKAVDAYGNALSGIDGVDVAYGVHANCWTNGQVVVMSAPAVCTNDSAGIMYECLGWSTNEVASLDNAVKGCEANISLATGNDVSFTWLWNVKAYRVRASSDPLEDNAVTPAVAWRVPGDRVTLVAKDAVSDGAIGLSEWKLRSVVADVECDPPSFRNGTAFSFTVSEPVDVTAVYERGSEPADEPVEYPVNISVNPQELEGLMDGEGSLAVGSNTTYDAYASFAAFSSDVVDATGGVWRCTGWVQNGVTNSISDTASLSGSGQADIELLWELQAPEEILPEPGDIAIKSIEKVDGKWVITVSGGVKDCWYWLYSSDDLSSLAGESSRWPAENIEKQQALEDGDIVFTVTSSEGKMFWRAKVTATETGDE